jgi:hypothetical protein
MLMNLYKNQKNTGEFVHPNVIYSMEIDANMRRLSVGAALSEAG